MNIIEQLTKQLMAKGYNENRAKEVAVKQAEKQGWIGSDGQITAKGEERGGMTPAERAIDRAFRRKPGLYRYNPETNKAVKID